MKNKNFNGYMPSFYTKFIDDYTNCSKYSFLNKIIVFQMNLFKA